MTAFSDLASAFEEVDATHPVQCGDASTRAFFDRAGTIRKVGGGQMQVEKDTLYIQQGALDPDLGPDVRIRVGALGAATADGGTLYYVAESLLQDDGLIEAIAIAGGVR